MKSFLVLTGRELLHEVSSCGRLFCLIAIRALISIAGFLLTGKLLAGAAAVAELLLITGGADTIPTAPAVIGRSTGVGKSALGFFFRHSFTPPEIYCTCIIYL